MQVHTRNANASLKESLQVRLISQVPAQTNKRHVLGEERIVISLAQIHNERGQKLMLFHSSTVCGGKWFTISTSGVHDILFTYASSHTYFPQIPFKNGQSYLKDNWP